MLFTSLFLGIAGAQPRGFPNVPGVGAVGLEPVPADVQSAMDHFSTAALRANMRFLADDLLEGRGTGTRGQEIAAHYVAAQFEAFGLEPAGATRGSYFQPVPFREVSTDPQGCEASITRNGKTTRLKWGEGFLSGGNALETGSPELPQLPLDPVARNGVPGSLWHGKAKPRVPRIVLALEPVEDEEACGRRASLPVDGVKVSRARQAMPALHFVLYAERRVRPLARRRLSMARPARVDIRARKPCRRFRRRTLG